MVKSIFDRFLLVILIIFLLIPMLLVTIAIRLTSKGPSLYWSDRVGKNNKIFKMPKFRSMLIGTPAVATHLLDNPDVYLSPIGGFLRSTSLDELPQLFSVLKGDMSFVGPRPALYNQDDLITLRTEKCVDKLLPGITGWAQVNGRDELSIPDKVALDVEYLNRQSFWFDMKILWMTFLKVVKRDGVSH
jgi:O-antigen biosynthesis protein WbqP